MRILSKLTLIGLAGCAPGGVATTPAPPAEVSHAWATFDQRGLRGNVILRPRVGCFSSVSWLRPAFSSNLAID